MRRDASSPISNVRLREERSFRGWSQQELADKVGTTKVNISRWERNITIPGPYFRCKLSEIFGKSAEELGLVSENKPTTLTPVAGTQPTLDLAFSDPTLPYLQHFVGREKHLQQLANQLCSGSGLHAITGIPGAGKTALVIALAHHPQIRHHFRDGILWCGLNRTPSIPELMSRWGGIFGLTEARMGTLTTSDAWARCLHEQIGARQMLLIIDDAWELADAVTFRLGGSNCVHLLTTRFPVIASSFARENVTHLHELNEEESLVLLEYLAPQVVEHYTSEVRDLVRLVGGLPLALTLVGRYLYVQAQQGQPRRTYASLLRLCKNVTERLHLSEPQVPWEHAQGWPIGTSLSLQGTIKFSESYLPAQAKEVLHALSVFPAKPYDFSEEAAVVVSAAPVEMLDLLVDSGLLESHLPGRYQLHQTIADYAALHRTDGQVEMRLVTFFVEFIQKHQYNNETLERDLHNILMALEQAFEHCLFTDVVRGVVTLAPFLEARRLYTLADKLLTRARHVALNLVDNESVVRIWLHLGKMAEYCSDFQQAEQAYFEGLTLARQLQQTPLIAHFLTLIASVLDDQGEFTRARPYLSEALTIVQTLDDRKQLSMVLQQLGESADNVGDSRKANVFYQRGLMVARQAENWEVVSALLQDLGVKAARRGDYQQATAYFEEGMTYALQRNDLQRQSAILMNQGILAFQQQDSTQAIALSLESLRLARIIDHRVRISSVLQNLGMMEGFQDHYIQAEVYFKESLELAKEIRHQWLMCETQCEWGFLLLRQRNFEAAQQQFQSMLVEARIMGAQLLVARAFFGLGQVEASYGKMASAFSYAHQSQILFEQVEDLRSQEVADWIKTVFLDEEGFCQN